MRLQWKPRIRANIIRMKERKKETDTWTIRFRGRIQYSALLISLLYIYLVGRGSNV